MRLAVAALVLSLFITSDPAAQSEAESLLTTAKTLKCTFPASVRTTWKGDVPTPQIRRTGNLSIEIVDMKVEQGSAQVATGRNTTKDLTMVVGERSRFFLDAGGGRVTLTTVLGEFSTGMRLKATHNIVDYQALEIASFRSEPEVIQHMGDCEVTQ